MATRFPVLLSLLLVFAACGEDATEKNTVLIQGRWAIYKALRNHKVTGTLEGIYFQFDNNGALTTNLPTGPEEPAPFVVKNSRLEHQYPGKAVVYDIISLNDSLLTLGLELRGIPFELYLKKEK